MPQDSRPRYNRDEDQRPATEPKGAERSSRSDKTLTDAGSGEPLRPRHRPNRSQSDAADGKRD